MIIISIRKNKTGCVILDEITNQITEFPLVSLARSNMFWGPYQTVSNPSSRPKAYMFEKSTKVVQSIRPAQTGQLLWQSGNSFISS